jgi:protein-S-isoprenylcysteine O-methyltransferase Ste14
VAAIYSSSTHSIVLYANFLCWVIFEIWVLSRERGTGRSGARDRGSSAFVIVTVVAGLFLAFNAPRIAPALDAGRGLPIVIAVGVVLIWGGMMFRYFAIRTLGEFFRTQVIIQQSHKLITTGLYAYLRNPGYTGSTMSLVGFGFVVGNWMSVGVLVAATLIAYSRRIPVEEQALRDRFGPEYDEYRRRTWALIPLVW